MTYLTSWASWIPDRRRYPAAGLLLVIILTLLACYGSSPTEAGGPGSNDSSDLDSLRIIPAPPLSIHDNGILYAKVWKGGVQVSQDSVVWRSLDLQVASATSSGIVTGFKPGTVRITASMRNVADTISLKVYALLRIESDLFVDLPNFFLPMGVGDKVQLKVTAVDVHGVPIPDLVSSVNWSSTDPAVLSVDASGLVTTHLANRAATVIAAAVDDTVRLPIQVKDIPAGMPATVRVVHGIPGLGTVRFRMTPGSEVSLAYGQSVDVPVLSGTLRVRSDAPTGGAVFGRSNGEFLGVISPNDHLSLFALGTTQSGFLQALWPPAAAVPSDSIQVQLVQSSTVLVVYLRPHGDPRSGLPELCYFDPGTISQYFERAAGDFDVIGEEKYEDHEIGRAIASAPGGSAVTILLTGGGNVPFGVKTFIDH